MRRCGMRGVLRFGTRAGACPCEGAGRVLHFGAISRHRFTRCEPPDRQRLDQISQMQGTQISGSGEFFLIARPNNSLSVEGRALVLGSLLFLSLAISVAFAFYGAWLVLPFTGVEMAVLVVAFAYMQRHAADYESIAIDGDRVLIERWETGSNRRYEFNRHWAQVVIHRERAAGSTVVALRSHGREIEFGQHLTEPQKLAVAQTLRQQFSNRQTH